MSSLALSATPSQMDPGEASGDHHPASIISRNRYIILQALVGIMLAYQLLFAGAPTVGRATSQLIVVGLTAMVIGLFFIPRSILHTTWFSGVLVGIDTAFVTATIYASGNARSDLYLSYFVLMLIAASVRRLSHVLAFSLLLCAGYGVVLYQGVVQTETLSAGHLLGIPVLLVMATFYGMALQTIGHEREQKTTLIESIERLKKAEGALQASRDQLETRIKGLKADLTKANDSVRQSQKERQGLERQLQESQKMEAIGRTAGGIANEFSHLVSVIGKQTGLVLSCLKPEDPLYGPVDEIFRKGEHAAALTAQLASLGLNDSQFRQALSLRSVLDDLQGIVRGLLPSSIQLEVAVDNSPLDIEVDREGLEQVLLHLAVNARDAMPNGGRLRIEAKTVSGDRGNESVNGNGLPASKILLQVSDTGSGMSHDTQSRMFEPFFSTKEMNVGLGLTAVYGIVKHNAGHLDIVSQPGQGTTVRIRFPMAAKGGSSVHSATAAVAAKGQETVLLVEPQEISRKLALSTLLRHRYQVLEASSAVEALMLAQQYAGMVHVAVSDLAMPEISGRDLAKRLVKQYPTMKPLFVSGYDDETMLSHRLNPQYLLKRPYRQTALVERVRQLLDA